MTQCGLRLTQITDEFNVSKVFLYNSLILISAHPKIMPDGSFQFLALWKTDNKYMYMILFFSPDCSCSSCTYIYTFFSMRQL